MPLLATSRFLSLKGIHSCANGIGSLASVVVQTHPACPSVSMIPEFEHILFNQARRSGNGNKACWDHSAPGSQ